MFTLFINTWLLSLVSYKLCTVPVNGFTMVEVETYTLFRWFWNLDRGRKKKNFKIIRQIATEKGLQMTT